MAVFPVPGGKFTNDWGAPRAGGHTHQGTDIFAPRGTPVVAVEDGTITKAGDDGGRGGLRVWLNGRWYFAHLDRLAKGIKTGTRVKAGQIIGYVGTSGDAKGTPPHLHFGYAPNGVQNGWKNPYELLVAWNKGKAPKPSADDTNSTYTMEDEYEIDRQQGIAASLSVRSDIPTVQAPVAGMPGEAPAIAPPKPPVYETWKLVGSLGELSPDTRSLLSYAELAYGDGS